MHQRLYKRRSVIRLVISALSGNRWGVALFKFQQFLKLKTIYSIQCCENGHHRIFCVQFIASFVAC